MEACPFKRRRSRSEIPGKPGKKEPLVVEKDEGPRKDTSARSAGALKPSFEKDAP